MPLNQDSASSFTAFATLASCSRPVDEYLRLAGRSGVLPKPAVSLGPVDTFLLHQVVSMLPAPTDVIDLAADATGGASVALWAAHPSVRAVWAPRRGEDAPWRDRFQDFAQSPPFGGDRDDVPPAAALSVRVRIDGPLFAPPAGWSALGAFSSASVLVFAAGADGVSALAGAPLKLPHAVFAVTCVGRVGEAGALELLLGFLRDYPHHRLRLLRELSPFLAQSDLAMVYPEDNEALPAALERIEQSFEGNFQFLNLINVVTAAALRDAAGADSTDNSTERGRQRAAPRPSDQNYPRLVERVRAAVREAVPAGASLLIVSKGDDDLLRVDDCRTSHFPQASGGAYAGHHPADDAGAVAQLEGLRVKGAEYLVLPATSVWWLEHYEGFRRHLESTADVVVCRPDTCIVFSLIKRQAAPEASVKRWATTIPYARLVEYLRDAVAKDVPPDAMVAVVSKGDSQLIDLPGRRGVHFPQTDEGVYAGHYPADSAAALSRLGLARAKGAQYLLFPATAFWWLDHYADFRRHLDQTYRRVRDDETCVVYALVAQHGPTSAWRRSAANVLSRWARSLSGGGAAGARRLELEEG